MEQAKETEEWQYTCLKKRIQYSYEHSNNMYLEAFLSAGSFGEILNLTEYFTQVASYDQEMLADYKAVSYTPLPSAGIIKSTWAGIR